MERCLSYTETQKRLVIYVSLLGTQTYTEMQCLLICPLGTDKKTCDICYDSCSKTAQAHEPALIVKQWWLWWFVSGGGSWRKELSFSERYRQVKEEITDYSFHVRVWICNFLLPSVHSEYTKDGNTMPFFPWFAGIQFLMSVVWFNNNPASLHQYICYQFCTDRIKFDWTHVCCSSKLGFRWCGFILL